MPFDTNKAKRTGTQSTLIKRVIKLSLYLLIGLSLSALMFYATFLTAIVLCDALFLKPAILATYDISKVRCRRYHLVGLALLSALTGQADLALGISVATVGFITVLKLYSRYGHFRIAAMAVVLAMLIAPLNWFGVLNALAWKI